MNQTKQKLKIKQQQWIEKENISEITTQLIKLKNSFEILFNSFIVELESFQNCNTNKIEEMRNENNRKKYKRYEMHFDQFN